MEEKRKNIFIVILVLIILFLVGVIAFMLLNNTNNNTNNNATKEKKNIVKKDNTEYEVTDSDYQKVLSTLYYDENSKVFSFKIDFDNKILFDNEKFNASQFTKHDLILIGLSSTSINKGYEFSMNIEELNNEIRKRVVGFNNDITLQDLKNNCDEVQMNTDYVYGIKNNTHEYVPYNFTIDGNNINVNHIGGYTGPADEDYYKKLEKVTQDDKNVYIYIKVAHGIWNKNEQNERGFVYNYYNPTNMNDIVETVLYRECDSNKYNTYKITYQKDKDNLLFSSIEIVK